MTDPVSAQQSSLYWDNMTLEKRFCLFYDVNLLILCDKVDKTITENVRIEDENRYVTSYNNGLMLDYSIYSDP